CRSTSAVRSGLPLAVSSWPRYARHAPPLAAVLVRTGIFIVCGSACWALLPVIARRALGLSALGYGLLLTCFGFGAVLGAALLPRVKRRFTVGAVVALAAVLFALVSALAGLWRFIPALGIAMLRGGVAWMARVASLSAAA